MHSLGEAVALPLGFGGLGSVSLEIVLAAIPEYHSGGTDTDENTPEELRDLRYHFTDSWASTCAKGRARFELSKMSVLVTRHESSESPGLSISSVQIGCANRPSVITWLI